MKNTKLVIIVLSAITALLSLFLLIGSQWIFTICQSEGTHGCTNADKAILGMSIIMILTACSALIFRDEKSLILASALNFAEGFMCMLLASAILNFCKLETMSCVAKFKPFVIIMGVIIMISAAINLLYGLYQLKKGKH